MAVKVWKAVPNYFQALVTVLEVWELVFHWFEAKAAKISIRVPVRVSSVYVVSPVYVVYVVSLVSLVLFVWL